MSYATVNPEQPEQDPEVVPTSDVAAEVTEVEPAEEESTVEPTNG
jgi:hypothetical protein